MSKFSSRGSVTQPHPAPPPLLEPGVPRALAVWRATRYRDLRYALTLTIDLARELAFGTVEIEVTLPDPVCAVVFDWRGDAACVRTAKVNGAEVEVASVAEHLVIDAATLGPGRNTVVLRFESPIAAAGTPILHYRDREDGSAYAYSLFVPADASALFPCFDQPDLKARFRLSLTMPEGWTAVSCEPVVNDSPGRVDFAETPPLSTYAFAFAAGPFEAIGDYSAEVPCRVLMRRSQRQRAGADAAEALRLARDGLAWHAAFLARPFPFAKHDLVLVPELAFGGMEHAGATFLREDAVLLPHGAGNAERLRRAQLVLHESAHQWMGDLVTMRWFDDLWLKEGFANDLAYRAADALVPGLAPRIAFHRLKTMAYDDDATPGAVAIRQAMPNLSAAKSAYGPAMYGKAPAVLRQAAARVGLAAYLRGVRGIVREHAWSSVDAAGLVRALSSAADDDLDAWAAAWIAQPGLPRVRLNLKTGDGAITQARVEQDDPSGTGCVWPLRIKAIAIGAKGVAHVADVALDGKSAAIDAWCGLPAPRIAFANFDDQGYGMFVLDRVTQEAVLDGLSIVRDPLLRAQLGDALWTTVLEGELAPERFVEFALARLRVESEDAVLEGLLGHLRDAVRRFLPELVRARMQTAIEDALLPPNPGRRSLTPLTTYIAVARTDAARERLRAMLASREVLDRPLRFAVLERLIALGDRDAARLLAREVAADPSDEAKRLAFAVQAAIPSVDVKGQCFRALLGDPSLPEGWIEAALGPFNTPEQSVLTAPFLEPALAALPALKRTRRIFFVNRWLAAFVGGQHDAAALATVRRFLAKEGLEEDLRAKVLVHADNLARIVRIRAAGEAGS